MAFGQCDCCKFPRPCSSESTVEFFANLRDAIEDANPNAGTPASSASTTQMVYLDFEIGEDRTAENEYTPAQRMEIKEMLEDQFRRFDVSFSLSFPTGEFSTLVFNEDASSGPGQIFNPPRTRIGGSAEGVDFRNLNRSDIAIVFVNEPNLSGPQLVTASANVAAHELGHLLGLRHADALGPIGTGISNEFAPSFVPAFEGPLDGAIEAENHIMGNGFPFNFENSFFTERLNWFSERSSARLVVAEGHQTVIDMDGNDTIADAQPMELLNQVVPNTIEEGGIVGGVLIEPVNAGTGDFCGAIAVVEGSLNGSDNDPVDIFRIEGRAGDILNLQVLSSRLPRLCSNSIDPTISVTDAAEVLLDYHGVDAFNEDGVDAIEFARFGDAELVDLTLTSDGPIFVQVGLSDRNPSESGNYELLVYRFGAVDAEGRLPTSTLGDVDLSGVVDFSDIPAFIGVLQSGVFQAEADCDCSTVVDFADIPAFIAILQAQ